MFKRRDGSIPRFDMVRFGSLAMDLNPATVSLESVRTAEFSYRDGVPRPFT
jgi:hypothetical protein